MDKTRLAAKFKRVSDWKEFLASAETSSPVKLSLLEILPKYETALRGVWEASDPSPEQDALLRDLERQLEDINERARLFTAGR